MEYYKSNRLELKRYVRLRVNINLGFLLLCGAVCFYIYIQTYSFAKLANQFSTPQPWMIVSVALTPIYYTTVEPVISGGLAGHIAFSDWKRGVMQYWTLVRIVKGVQA